MTLLSCFLRQWVQDVRSAGSNTLFSIFKCISLYGTCKMHFLWLVCIDWHCVKYRNFTWFHDVEILWKGIGDSLETMRRLRLSTKFPHHEIRWNYDILRSVNKHVFHKFKIQTVENFNFLMPGGNKKVTHT